MHGTRGCAFDAVHTPVRDCVEQTCAKLEGGGDLKGAAIEEGARALVPRPGRRGFDAPASALPAPRVAHGSTHTVSQCGLMKHDGRANLMGGDRLETPVKGYTIRRGARRGEDEAGGSRGEGGAGRGRTKSGGGR